MVGRETRVESPPFGVLNASVLSVILDHFAGAASLVGVMPQFKGSLRMAGEAGPGLRVVIDLTDDSHLQIAASQDVIGDWSLDDVGIRAADDGFHLLAEGEEVIIRTDNDPAFAVAVGLRNAPTVLRRQMSELLRNDATWHERAIEKP